MIFIKKNTKFFTGKLGQFDFAKSCFEFHLPLVNIITPPIGLIYGIYFQATS